MYQLNVKVEEVRGMNPEGEIYNGVIYSAMDDNGNRTGTPFKASLFGKQVGYDALQNKFGKSAQTVKEKRIREQLIPVIRKAIQTTHSQKELELLLRKEKIQPVFRQNDEQRIYGVTFIDHNSWTVLNGSRLGKEFSANTFHELFNTLEKPEKLNTGKENIIQAKPEEAGIRTSGLQHPSGSHDNAASLVDALFSLLTTENHYINPHPQEDELWLRKKKKKKKGRRMG